MEKRLHLGTLTASGASNGAVEGLARSSVIARDASFEFCHVPTAQTGQQSAPVSAAVGSSPFTGLHDINLDVHQGELIGIVGVVGRWVSIPRRILHSNMNTQGFWSPS